MNLFTVFLGHMHCIVWPSTKDTMHLNQDTHDMDWQSTSYLQFNPCGSWSNCSVFALPSMPPSNQTAMEAPSAICATHDSESPGVSQLAEADGARGAAWPRLYMCLACEGARRRQIDYSDAHIARTAARPHALQCVIPVFGNQACHRRTRQTKSPVARRAEQAPPTRWDQEHLGGAARLIAEAPARGEPGGLRRPWPGPQHGRRPRGALQGSTRCM